MDYQLKNQCLLSEEIGKGVKKGLIVVGLALEKLVTPKQKRNTTLNSMELEVGDTVRFVGLNARPFETIGRITDISGAIVHVKWDSDNRDSRPLHSSQVRLMHYA